MAKHFPIVKCGQCGRYKRYGDWVFLSLRERIHLFTGVNRVPVQVKDTCPDCFQKKCVVPATYSEAPLEGG